METAIGAANWLVGKVLNKLSDDLIAAYAASSELGFNSEQIKTNLMYVQGLLHVAKERDVSSNPGLQNLLEDLSKKADKAEDTLDELHYFLIQDQLEGASPELGHCCLAARHNIGNWLACLTSSCTQDDDSADSGSGKLKFDRVAIFKKIKLVIELTNSTHHAETLSVLPFVGPGGIGKRTFAQHLYNDKRIEAHFAAGIRVCVSTDFDVTKLTRQILSCIFNLETAATMEEASGSKLKNKRYMDGLRLVWGIEHLTVDDDVLDNLQSHPNLRVLGVINPGIAAGPCWSYGDMSRKKLVSLLVEGLSWDSLPPFEQRPYLTKLILKNIIGMTVFGPGFGGVTEASFVHLKTILFENMPQLVEWVGLPNSHLFSTLENITFRDCPLLCSFPFLECSGRFTNLSTLDIDNCPMLSQFPPMPHNSTLRSMIVKSSVSEVEVSYNGHSLSIDGYNGALVFHNMNKVELIKIRGVSHISLSEIQKLKSLRTVDVQRCENMFTAELDDSVVLYSVQNLVLQELCIKGELFSKVLKCFPALSRLVIQSCMDLDLLPVEDGGLGDLTMLQSFTVVICAKLFCRWPMGEAVGAHTIKPFPPSLTILEIVGDKSMKSMALLSNLTCLTILRLVACEELTIDGFNPLMTVNLKELIIYNNNYRFTDKESISIARDLLAEVGRSKLMHAGSFQLERVNLDSIMALLIAPICSHLAGTLYKLEFSHDNLVKSFTEEQEQALQLLISLQELTFDSCCALQTLPEGLHHISSLRKLEISFCDRIQLLPPKERLPTSLQIIQVRYCSSELTELANKLKETDPYFSALLEVKPR